MSEELLKMIRKMSSVSDMPDTSDKSDAVGRIRVFAASDMSAESDMPMIIQV